MPIALPSDLRRATRFRRPPRTPIESFDVPVPLLPAGLDGLTILHLTDLHVRRFRPGRERFLALLRALDDTEPDLAVFTGDLMDEPGHERAALDTLRAISSVLHPSLGAIGIFGNHDTPALRRACRAEIPGILWPGDQPNPWIDFTHAGAAVRLLALDWPEDPLNAALALSTSLPPPSSPPHSVTPSPFPIILAHYPTTLIPAAALGLPLVLAGHTHAGQVRLSPRFAPHTSSDIPPNLATGILRLQNTLCCISRGIGEGLIEDFRVNCPWQAPVYTLRRSEARQEAGMGAGAVTQIACW